MADLMSMFSSLLSAAVDDGRLDRNVLYRKRLPGARAAPKEKAWVTPEQALTIADAAYSLRVSRNADLVTRPQDRLMLLTAMWTGMRWGELAGLHRDNCGLLRRSDGVKRSVIRVDSEVGALHEDPRSHQLWLGPPKPPNGAREVDLPPFLAEELAQLLSRHPSPYPFTNGRGGWWQRTAFTRRVLQPALMTAARSLSGGGFGSSGSGGEYSNAIIPGRSSETTIGIPNNSITSMRLTFHGFRHSHKTLLIELGVPEVLQCERLGHAQPGMPGLYSHVAGPVRAAMLAALQVRWERPVSQTGTARPQSVLL